MMVVENCGEPLRDFRRASAEIVVLFQGFQLSLGSTQMALRRLGSDASDEHHQYAEQFGQITEEYLRAVRKEQIARIAGNQRKVRVG